MNKIFKKITEEMKGASLRQDEKDVLLSKISSYMRENPIEQGVASPYIGPVINTDPVRHIEYNNDWSKLFTLSTLKQRKFMPILIILMLVLGGGTSFAANYALPGDALYGVKTHVNENVRSFLAFGANQNAKVEADIARERLEEAEKLAIKGTISTDVKNELENNFNLHAGNVKALVAKMESNGDLNGAAQVNSNFENTLDVHDAILIAIAKSDQEDKDKIDDLKADVDAHLKTTVEARVENEQKVVASDNANIEAKAQGSLNAASNKIAEAKKYLENNSSDVSAEAKAEATAELKSADDLVASGKAKLEAKAYADAYILFDKAFRMAEHAKLILNSENDLNINTGNLLKIDYRQDINGNDNSASGNGGTKVETNINSQTGVQTNSGTKVENKTNVGGSINLGL